MHPMWMIFGVTLAGALLLTRVARRLAMRLQVVDWPDGTRKLHKNPIPLLGGVAVYLALVLGLMVVRFGPFAAGPALDELADVLIAAAGFVCLVGCVDDTWDLNARFKLLLQACSVLPVVLGGYAIDRLVVFGYPIELGLLGIPLTVFWLVGCINALNLLDGMDGLAAVVGLSTAVMLAIIAESTGHHHVTLIAIALAGALAGFLVYNLPPASIYLGDSGSMVIGLVVGIISIQGSLKTSATLSMTAPAVVMSIPMLDTVLAIVRRKLTGRRFFVADRGHIHHRLLERGLSNWQALGIIGALCLTTGGAATAATTLRVEWLAWITALSVVVLLVRLRVFGHHELSLVKLTVAGALVKLVHRLTPSALPRWRLRALDPETTTFEEAWQCLVEEAQAWQADSLQLVVYADRNSTVEHAWQNPDAAASDGYQWSLSLRFGQPEQGHSRLKVTGLNAAAISPWQLMRVASVLKLFGQHWADHPDSVPPATLKLAAQTPAPASPRKKAA